MERAVLVYTTWPSIVEAEQAGRTIVERRLAACVNILPRVVPISQLGGSLQSGCSRGDYSDALFASSRGAPTSNCDVGYCPDNGHSEVASRRPLSANGLNRSRDRVLRRAARATGYWDVSVLS
jgi:hypothetical protein